MRSLKSFSTINVTHNERFLSEKQNSTYTVFLLILAKIILYSFISNQFHLREIANHRNVARCLLLLNAFQITKNKKSSLYIKIYLYKTGILWFVRRKVWKHTCLYISYRYLSIRLSFTKSWGGSKRGSGLWRFFSNGFCTICTLAIYRAGRAEKWQNQ